MLVPLFPGIKEAFALNYTELGLLMTVFFVVSGVGQAASGFLVDRIGAFPVLLGSLALFVIAALGMALSPGYGWLLLFSGLAGLANASFHPVDYSIMNARVESRHLGPAYALHGVSGSLGWAVAPLYMAGIASVSSWRWALVAAAGLAATILAIVWFYRELLSPAPVPARPAASPASLNVKPTDPAPGTMFSFLRLPAVWMSFGFFGAYAFALGGVQSFGAQAASDLHTMPATWVAMLLSAYMVASAVGMVVGGALVTRPERADKVMAAGFSVGVVIALILGYTPAPGWLVPVLFAAMGFAIGLVGPSRDLLVRSAAPPGATGRVYGFVYSGLDVGMAIAPAVFGWMMDHRLPQGVWLGIAVFQLVMIASVLGIGSRVRTQQVVIGGR
jgi:MFS family permease